MTTLLPLIAPHLEKVSLDIYRAIKADLDLFDLFWSQIASGCPNVQEIEIRCISKHFTTFSERFISACPALTLLDVEFVDGGVPNINLSQLLPRCPKIEVLKLSNQTFDISSVYLLPNLKILALEELTVVVSITSLDYFFENGLKIENLTVNSLKIFNDCTDSLGISNFLSLKTLRLVDLNYLFTSTLIWASSLERLFAAETVLNPVQIRALGAQCPNLKVAEVFIGENSDDCQSSLHCLIENGKRLSLIRIGFNKRCEICSPGLVFVISNHDQLGIVELFGGFTISFDTSRMIYSIRGLKIRSDVNKNFKPLSFKLRRSQIMTAPGTENYTPVELQSIYRNLDADQSLKFEARKHEAKRKARNEYLKQTAWEEGLVKFLFC